jgi:transposase
MSSKKFENIQRFNVGGFPIIRSTIKKLEIDSILSDYLQPNGNEKTNAVNSLLLLVYNITLGRQPLYELKNWIEKIDLGYLDLDIIDSSLFNDDRFGRALDKLYYTDRASLMTQIVTKMIKAEKLDLSRIHNDSTTVKACGKYKRKTKTGFHLAQGNSKDHRPDLKQLVFSLSVSSDGTVPVHHKVYSGNRTDDTTHIETWQVLNDITGFPHFIYVADCKVCTSKQLEFIVSNGGRVVTTIPKTWTEYKTFIESLRMKRKKKQYLWRRSIPGSINEYETYSIYAGEYSTIKNEYRLYWYHSSEKQKIDRQNRENRLRKAERELLALSYKLNKRKLKIKESICEKINDILSRYGVQNLIEFSLVERTHERKIQIGRGRPCSKTKYRIEKKIDYSLIWDKNNDKINREKRIDGIFPLLTTDASLSAKDVLKYYKYQPRLEKRFMQFKSYHFAAPLLLKKPERIESIMFVYFISLIVQAIIERKVRTRMKEHKIKSLPIYPEGRDSYWPTTSKILDIFDGVSSYKFQINGKTKKTFRDSLTDTQKKLLKLFNIDIREYWNMPVL